MNVHFIILHLQNVDFIYNKFELQLFLGLWHIVRVGKQKQSLVGVHHILTWEPLTVLKFTHAHI